MKSNTFCIYNDDGITIYGSFIQMANFATPKRLLGRRFNGEKEKRLNHEVYPIKLRTITV